MNQKGSLSLLVLQVLQNGDSHGYQIAKDIKQKSAGTLDFKEGTLYPTLHNLEQQGCITSYTAEENGRQRRYYRLTPIGQQMLSHERDEWLRYQTAVNKILDEGSST